MESQFKKGVSLLRKDEDYVTYRFNCSCGDNEHNVDISFEVDEEFKLITMIFYKDISFSHYWIYRNILWFDEFKRKKNILKAILYFTENTFIYYFKCFWCRTKAALRLLFTGYLKMDSDFLIEGGEQIDNFILALQEGRDIIKEG